MMLFDIILIVDQQYCEHLERNEDSADFLLLFLHTVMKDHFFIVLSLTQWYGNSSSLEFAIFDSRRKTACPSV